MVETDKCVVEAFEFLQYYAAVVVGLGIIRLDF